MKDKQVELLPIWQEDDAQDEVPASPSVELPTLSDKEEEFFSIVESGDVEKAGRYLEKNKDLNINYRNYQGLTALHMAVRSRSLQMLQLLLDAEGVQLGDAALHAVRDDQPAMASALLQRLGPPAEFSGCRDSSEFPEHVTPLMLAAISGHYRTVQMLLRRRHVLARPHPPSCLRQTREDSLKAVAARMDAYRAACSPAYLCQASRDPVLEAFQLYHELTQCAHLFVAFHDTYSQLAAGCRALAVDLMGECSPPLNTGHVSLAFVCFMV